MTLQTAVYRDSDIAAIAKALNVSAGHVEPFLRDFNAAALWFSSTAMPFERRSPTQLRKKLEQIGRDARRLLKQLGIDDPSQALDGPGDREVFDALGLWTGTEDNVVTEATGRISRLVALLDALDAAKLLERIAKRAAGETADLGRLTVPPGNSGDRATNEWIADMMAIYKRITGQEPATSVGAPGRNNEGIAAGPLIRFLQAAGAPLGIRFGEDAFRKRVRAILEHHRSD